MYILTNVMSSHTIEETEIGFGYVARMDMKARIFKARSDAGMTQEQLAVAVGKTRGAVAQWEAGNVRPRHSTLIKIANATRKSLAWLEAGGYESGDLSIFVVGEVAAGMWKEADVYFEPYSMPVAPDQNYPAEAQRLYKVSGTSVNRYAEDGAYLHAVDIHAAALTPEDGDLVIVRRTEHGKTEYTAKTMTVVDGRWVLRPESSDPRWQADIEITGDDGVEIEVTDIVIASWAPIPRRRKRT